MHHHNSCNHFCGTNLSLLRIYLYIFLFQRLWCDIAQSTHIYFRWCHVPMIGLVSFWQFQKKICNKHWKRSCTPSTTLQNHYAFVSERQSNDSFKKAHCSFLYSEQMVLRSRWRRGYMFMYRDYNHVAYWPKKLKSVTKMGIEPASPLLLSQVCTAKTADRMQQQRFI